MSVRATATSRRDEILDVAAKQLNARGLSQTSLSDLAGALGFTRNALYHYVEDISDLLAQVYRRSCALLDSRLDEASTAGAPLAILQRFVTLALDGSREEIAALNEYGLLRPDTRAEVTALYAATEARLAVLIAQGIEAGELRACDPGVAARTIINLVHWAPLAARRGLKVGIAERAETANTLNALLAHGWAIDRGTPIAPPSIDLSPLIVRVADGFDRTSLDEMKRASILACASRLFNSRGVDSTSLDELARVLGTTKPRLYKYVGDKATLVEQCFARADTINRYILQAARDLPCGPMDKLAALLRTATAVRLSTPLEPMRYFFADDLQGVIGQELVTRRMQRMVDHNTQLFREGQALGVVRVFELDGLRLLNLTGGGGIVRPAEALSPAVWDTAAQMVDVLRLGLARI